MHDPDIAKVGKGAIPDLPDERDYRFEQVLGRAEADFEKGFQLPEPPNENQGTSLSCVSHATSYYHWQLKGKDYSRRDLYSEIYLPEGGAYLRDGVKRLVDYGQATKDEVTDPPAQNESNMRNKSGVTREKQSSDIESAYFVIPDGSINGVALAIQNYKGCIFGLYGTNKGWQDITEPTPPSSHSEPGIWGHALYGFGFGIKNGRKYILAKSSWCQGNHHVHYIYEEYFTKHMTFNAWVLIPKQEAIGNMRLVKDNGTVYLVSGVNDKRKLGIADEVALGIFGDEPQEEMDTSAIPQYNTMTTGIVIHNK